MRKYFTLVQEFDPSNHGDSELGTYLTNQGIVFQLGADFNYELCPFGYQCPPGSDQQLLKTYTVLIEEHELSAIMLSVGGVQVIQNRNSVNRKNKVRSMFSWFVK